MKLDERYHNKKVLVTGGVGFIGSHLSRKLVRLGAKVTIIDDLSRGVLSHIDDIKDEVTFVSADLRNENQIQKYFLNQEIVFNLAALNTGVDFDLGRTEVMFEENMLLQMIPLRVASKVPSIHTFVQISSASVYSREAMEKKVPTPEDADTCDPEPSKLGYALAKKMGEQLAKWYSENTHLDCIRVRFINVYGEDDNYDNKGHFIPVMIRKFIEADTTVSIFGSGKQKRSFMYVEDAVNALLLLGIKGRKGEVYNVDSNQEKSVREVVEMIELYFKEKKLELFFDRSKPEGSQRRILDSTKLKKLGWIPKMSFEEGLSRTVKSIRNNYAKESLLPK